MAHEQLLEILGLKSPRPRPPTNTSGYFEKYGEPTGTQSRLRDLAELLGHTEDRTGPNLRGDEELSIQGSPRELERLRQYRFQNPPQVPGGEKERSLYRQDIPIEVVREIMRRAQRRPDGGSGWDLGLGIRSPQHLFSAPPEEGLGHSGGFGGLYLGERGQKGGGASVCPKCGGRGCPHCEGTGYHSN